MNIYETGYDRKHSDQSSLLRPKAPKKFFRKMLVWLSLVGGAVCLAIDFLFKVVV